MFSGLFARKSRANSAIQQAEAEVAAKRRTVAETKKQLEALQRQRGGVVSSQYDQQALLRLTNDDAEKAQQIENTIADLTAQIPLLDKEIADLESQILPRLTHELEAAEHAVQELEGTQDAALRHWYGPLLIESTLAEDAVKHPGTLKR